MTRLGRDLPERHPAWMSAQGHRPENGSPLLAGFDPQVAAVLFSASHGRGRTTVGRSEYDPVNGERRAWNAGRKIGAKRALKPQQVWAVSFWLDR